VKNLCKPVRWRKNRCRYQLTLWALRPHKVCCDVASRYVLCQAEQKNCEPVDDQGRRALGAIVIFSTIGFIIGMLLALSFRVLVLVLADFSYGRRHHCSRLPVEVIALTVLGTVASRQIGISIAGIVESMRANIGQRETVFVGRNATLLLKWNPYELSPESDVESPGFLNGGSTKRLSASARWSFNPLLYDLVS
jgi:hypothetical protein